MSSETEAPIAAASKSASATSNIRGVGRRMSDKRFLAVLVLLVALFVYFSVSQAQFLTKANIDDLLSSVSILWVLAMGLTFVMLAGGFDLSVGAILTLSGIMLGSFFVDSHMPALVAVLLTMLCGAGLGLVNGFFIGRVGLPFLVVTLGTYALYGGVLNLWSSGHTTPIVASFFDNLAFGSFLGVLILVWIMAATMLIAWYVLRQTYFGRDVYAVGGNSDAARLSGVHVSRTLMAVYAIAGLMAALGGVIQAARIGAASPLVGGTILFDATAAVLLGGTSFSGGVGGVGGTALGVLFLGVLQNGLSVAAVQSFWQQVITGVILITVVLLDKLQREGGATFLSRGWRRKPG